jgi:nucleoside triphosphate diphosphatase
MTDEDLQQLRRLFEVMERLRAPGGCPWDRAQTHQTLLPFLLEETYETIQAAEEGSSEDLAEELGDLLVEVAMHSAIAAEAGTFDIGTVARIATEKMISRHPHVFGGTVMRNAAEQTEAWEAHKTVERAARAETGALAGVPVGLPALLRAAKLTARAARVGFDWPDAIAVLTKLDEEVAELRAELSDARPERLVDEVGDLLFVLANLARKLDLDPEACLQQANLKFYKRFRAIEQAAAAKGKTLAEMSLEEMESEWQKVKHNKDLGT